MLDELISSRKQDLCIVYLKLEIVQSVIAAAAEVGLFR